VPNPINTTPVIKFNQVLNLGWLVVFFTLVKVKTIAENHTTLTSECAVTREYALKALPSTGINCGKAAR
jgi:hypothetical protein